MSNKTAIIKLGDFEFTAHKFNLGETEEVTDLQDAMKGAAGLRGRLVAMRKIMLIAARRTKPDLTEDDLKKIEATPGELTEAVMTIMRLNGYVTKAGASVGEKPADDRAA